MKQSIKATRGTFVSALTFIIAPFISFIISFFRMKNERNLWVIFFFYLLFGLCFTINEKTGFDSIRYVTSFESINANGTFRDIYASNIICNGDAGDVYFPIIAWMAKRIVGNNYHIMFLMFAIVFAFFTVKSIKIFYEAYRPPKYWLYLVAVLLLITNNFIFNINGMRFWTAAWILAYGILQYFVKNNKVGLFLVLVTPLVHSTFLIPIAIFLTSIFIGKAQKVWIILLWLSIPFSFLSIELIPIISSYIPDIYISKFDFYTNSNYIAQRGSGVGFAHLEKFLQICKMIVEAFVLYKLYHIKKNNNNWKYQKLFHFTLIFVTLSNFFSAIPSVGRYIIVGLPFVMFFIWINLNRKLFIKCLILLSITMSFSILDLFLNKVLPTIPSDFFYSNLISLVSDFI